MSKQKNNPFLKILLVLLLGVFLASGFLVYKQSRNHIYGGILPHHLMVKDRLEYYLENIKDEYEAVVLITPNHFSAGHPDIILGGRNLKTPNGDLEIYGKLYKKLAEEYVTDDEAIENELAVDALAPLIKKYFPKAEFLPVILKVSTSENRAGELAGKIYRNINPKKVLVLSTVDFSHYLPATAGEFHDLRSRSVLESFDFERIYGLEVDSQPALYVLEKYLEKTKAEKGELVFHTNSGLLLNLLDEPGTTHNFYYFRKGEPSADRGLSFLFFGDLMTDRYIKTLMDRNGLEYIFEDLLGEEQRFFKGTDVVGANLEGPATYNGEHYDPEKIYDFAQSDKYIAELKKYGFNFFNLANNHFIDQGSKGIEQTRKILDKQKISYSGCPGTQVGECSFQIKEYGGQKIAFLGFNITDKYDEQEILKTIAKVAGESDYAIVNIHWGVEYEREFNEARQNLAHKMIDSGADAIIGHHPHVVQGMEIYKNKPIFYSLGNFLFDQLGQKDTSQGLGIGLYIDQSGLQTFLFPTKFNGKLTLQKGAEKQEFLKEFANLSEVGDNYKEEIREGWVKMTNFGR